VAARSKAWVCGRSPAGVTGSNNTWGMHVFCECCQVEVSALGLITRPEWCVVVCDLDTSLMRRFWPTGGGRAVAAKEKK
jgi:hypothetical protein